MRFASAFLLILCLTGCGRKIQSNDAVKQAVLERLGKVGMNVQAMDVNMTNVEFKGNQADVTVTIAPKGNTGAGMSMKYHLEQQNDKWVVMGRQDAGAPHGGGMMPGAANPHGEGGAAMPPDMPNPHGGGAAMPPAAGQSSMPSPQDLPPAGKKK